MSGKAGGYIGPYRATSTTATSASGIWSLTAQQQRVGAVWSEVEANIKKFNSKRSEKFITEIYPTINTQNVFYIPEFLFWLRSQTFSAWVTIVSHQDIDATV